VTQSNAIKPSESFEAPQEALCHILGNTLSLAETTLNFRWNVIGHFHMPLHGLFKDQADELWQAADRIGERIRALDAMAVADRSDDLILPCVKMKAGEPVCEQMICILKQAHGGMALAIKAAIDVARADDDDASILLLSERLLAHAGHLRTLAAFE